MLEKKDRLDAFGYKIREGDIVAFPASNYFMAGIVLHSAKVFDVLVKYPRSTKGVVTKRKPTGSLIKIDEAQLGKMRNISTDQLLYILMLQEKVREHFKITEEK